MKNIFLSILLSISLVCLPFYAYAGEADPDDSLITNGKVTVLSQGATAPYTGILFDIPAATKLKLDKEFAQKEFELKLDLEKRLLTVEHNLKLGIVQTNLDSLKSKHEALMKIKSEEIERLQEIIKDSPNDWNQAWFIGGIVVGCLLSLGVYYAAVEISK
jgi:hypothetical protein